MQTAKLFSCLFLMAASLAFTPVLRAGTILTASGGTAAGAEAALIAGMLSGQTYANIHDVNFPGGEIRGQLQVVPEPGTMLLLIAGLVPLFACYRRLASRS